MMKKRYIDFVPVQTTTKSSSKIISSTPAKPVENFSLHKTTKTTSAKPINKPLSMSPKATKTLSEYVKPPVKPPVKPAAKPVEKPVTPKPNPIPTPQFINTEKIAKRPLSNSAPKKPAATAASKAPASSKEAVIIDTPKKHSKIGLIIAIVLTIIFGAAVGALAFLVLPK